MIEIALRKAKLLYNLHKKFKTIKYINHHYKKSIRGLPQLDFVVIAKNIKFLFRNIFAVLYLRKKKRQKIYKTTRQQLAY